MPNIEESKLNFLSKKLRNLAKDDLKNQLEMYKSTGEISHKIKFGDTNICEPQYGCWTERLENFSFYNRIFKDLGIDLKFDSGQWITNYKFVGFNLLFHFINKITNILPSRLKIMTGSTLILIGIITKSKK